MDSLDSNRQHRKYPGVNVRLGTWPGHLDWTSLWKILCECVGSKANKPPWDVRGLNWAEPSLPWLHIPVTLSSVWSLWAGQVRAEQNSHLAVHHHQRGLCCGVLLSFVVMLKYLSEGPHCAVGGVKQPVWKCGCLSLNTVFKHGWIFIHVAEAGLPCKCVLKVFHLPNPSCTSDNLQYYFFC